MLADFFPNSQFPQIRVVATSLLSKQVTGTISHGVCFKKVVTTQNGDRPPVRDVYYYSRDSPWAPPPGTLPHFAIRARRAPGRGGGWRILRGGAVWGGGAMSTFPRERELAGSREREMVDPREREMTDSSEREMLLSRR